MSRFENAVAVITGGGSGIGEATARRIAEEGGKVVIAGRTEEKLKKAAENINNQVNRESVVPFVCDVTSEEDCEALVQFVKENFGSATVLINNAGGSAHSNIQGTSLERWEQIQKLNLTSVFLLSKLFGEQMIEDTSKQSENRAIVNVSSLSGHKPGANFPHYSAAKAGVINVTKALSFEYAKHGIRVNSVSPGFVETPLTERSLQDERFVEKVIKRKTLMRRAGAPEEIANVITFLASDEASYVTGIDVLVDGGYMRT